MKSEKPDMEFLLRAKKKKDPLSDRAEAASSTRIDPSILHNAFDEPEDNPHDRESGSGLLSEEKTSEFEINEEAVDLMWVLKKDERKEEETLEFQVDNSAQADSAQTESTIESEEVESDSQDENDWEPLILPEEPDPNFADDDEGFAFSLPDEDKTDEPLETELKKESAESIGANDYRNDLKLIIEEIEKHKKPEDDEESQTSGASSVGVTSRFDEKSLSFEFEEENAPGSSKAEINKLIDFIHPEDTEEGQSEFKLENPAAAKKTPDITNLLLESEEAAKSFPDDDDALDDDLSLVPQVSESTSEKKAAPQSTGDSQKPDAPAGVSESAFSGFLKERQQGKDGKPAPAPKLKEALKPKQATPRFSGHNSFSFKDLFESHSLLGLDVGSNSMKYVHLKKSGRSLKLINLRLAINPAVDAEFTKEENNEILAKHLSGNFNIKDFKNTAINTAISGMEVVFKNVQVPHMAKKELAKAVPWACRKDFPFPLESTVFDFKNITDAEKKDSKWDMFVVAGQKELINTHLNLLGGSRVLPAKISTIPEALWRAFQLGDKKDSTKCHILMDIGSNSSHIVFINKGRLEFAREISTAGADLTKALAGVFFVDGREIEISMEEAEKIKQQYGIPQNDADIMTDAGIPMKEFSVMMGPVLERLISNVQRTIEFYKEKFKVREIEGLYLTGGGSLTANLPAKIGEELNLKVMLFNPFDFISLKKVDNADKLKHNGPLFAVPVGLAIAKTNELNLLPRELKGSYTIEYLKKMYKYVFIIFILAMAFMSQSVARKIGEIEAEFHRLKTEFRNSEPMRKKYLALQNTHQNLLAVKSRYGNSLDSDVHAINYLKVISNAIPENITLTSLRVFYRQVQKEDAQAQANNTKGKKGKTGQSVETVEKEFVVVDGIAFESNSMEGMNLATFIMNLEKINYFSAISLTSQKIREDGSLQFTIECQPFEAE